MKHVLLVVVAMFVAGLAGKAQSKFSLGPNVGIGSSWISNTPNSKAKVAGDLGLSLVYSAAEHFALGLDAKYSFEGGKFSSNNQTTTANLNYFRVPLKAIYFFGSYGKKVRPKIYAGPSFGFLAGGKTTIESTIQTITVNSKNYYKSFDFGVMAGAGLNVRLVKNTWFNADVNYLHGISDVQMNSDRHNRTIGLNIGVNFGL